MEPHDQQPYGQFDALIERHRNIIKTLCMFRADGNVQLCGELVQDCYISLWRHLPSLRERASLFEERAWVVWQCRSAFSRLRHGKTAPKLLPIDDVMADTLAQPEEEDYLRESIEAMSVILTPYEKRAFEMMAEGSTIGEMARELDIEYGSAAKLRYRIYKKLRSHFNPQYNKTKKGKS